MGTRSSVLLFTIVAAVATSAAVLTAQQRLEPLFPGQRAPKTPSLFPVQPSTASTDACCHERHEPVGESEAACRVRDDADPSAARRRSEDRRPARSREAEESDDVHHPSGAAVDLLVRRLTPKLQLPTSKVSDWELDRWALGVDWRQFLTAVLSSSHPG